MSDGFLAGGRGKKLMLANDPKAFAYAVVTVLSDSALATRLGKNAAELVRQNFGWRLYLKTWSRSARQSSKTKPDEA